MRCEHATSSTINELWGGIEQSVRGAEDLEHAAQDLAKAIHSVFDESVVIARVFTTVPFESLPSSNQEFVTGLVGHEVQPKTPVLSLIGTHGQQEDWTDRRKSKGHIGIPLVSSEFVGGIPMISRLLKELGVPLEWVDSHDSEMIIRTMGQSAGLFFVDDASDSTDHQGRKIIAAQDFVDEYGVKSVFGTGGAYPNGQIMVVVVFCRDEFTRGTAEKFVSVTNLFLSQTSALANPASVFAAA
jgi:hypothetical protein